MLSFIVVGLLIAPPTPGTHLIISDRAIADTLDASAVMQPSHRRDSVKNGAVIGAIVGAAVFGGYVTFLCNALQEPSDPSCLGSSLLGIAIGAGGGAAAGAGVDALLHHAPPGFRVTVLKKTW